MHKEVSAEVLHKVASQTLQDAAFVFTEPISDPAQWPGEIVEVGLNFEGPRKGRLRLRATKDFGTEIAGNLMGADAEDAEQSAPAALAELVNIVGGSLMVELFTTKVVCHLGIPEVSVCAVHPDTVQPSVSIGLIADDLHRLDFDLFIEDRN
jgi:hypothetical protein